MRRTHRAFLLAATLSSAPFALTATAHAAPPSSAASPTSGSAATGEPAAGTIPRVELDVPPTPMPLSLPDPARPEEVRGAYGLGVVTLTAGALIAYGLIYALIYFTMRRSWSGAH